MTITGILAVAAPGVRASVILVGDDHLCLLYGEKKMTPWDFSEDTGHCRGKLVSGLAYLARGTATILKLLRLLPNEH